MEKEKKGFDFAFRKENYILMGVGVLLLILGYVLLSGGGSDDPNVFSEALFNTRRLVVAPLVIGRFHRGNLGDYETSERISRWKR